MTVRPVLDAVLAPLKGFQRATVDYAFERLFLAPDSTGRFLIADEVGLGKTLAARGVVARTIDHLWEQGGRIDVVYICSNAAIARQNLGRLVVGDVSPVRVDRLTLLATGLHELDSRLNFVALTPGTSFDLKTSLGRREERALLFVLLRRAWSSLERGAEQLLQGNIDDLQGWKEELRSFEREKTINEDLGRRFAEELRRADTTTSDGIPPRELRSRFGELCAAFAKGSKWVSQEERGQRRDLVGELRALLAATSVRALEPDLIILDEFQRFRHLLTETDEAGMLARELLEFRNGEERARILLLSATPYKMYTLDRDSDGDDHYRDFLQTVSFLEGRTGGHPELEVLLRDFRRTLLRAGGADANDLVALRERIEGVLRQVICRSERIRSGGDDGMLREVLQTDLELEPGDVHAFVRAEAVAKAVECASVLEYWKSAPYLLNFMDDYQLKRQVEESLESSELRSGLEPHLRPEPGHLLSRADLEQYSDVDPGNARLRGLVRDLDRHGAWEVLWVPPTLPYYRLEGPFSKAAEGSGLSKRLIFSAWNVVPKALAALLSYEAERRVVPKAYPEARNTAEERKRRSPLLRFARSEGRLTGLPVVAWLYPGTTLAEVGDPAAFASRQRARGGQPALSDLIAQATEEFRRLLPDVTRNARPGSQPDESWYWAAPLLLDLREGKCVSARAWIEEPDLAYAWQGDEDEGEEDASADASAWEDHVEQFLEAPKRARHFGPPPADLAEVLAYFAVAGPAVCALRALGRSAPPGRVPPLDRRLRAGRLAWSLRSLFNRQESMAVVRGSVPGDAYWYQVLRYSAAGCLQSVLDEFAHLLIDAEGLLGRRAGEVEDGLTVAISEALGLRTSRVVADLFQPGAGKAGRIQEKAPLRVHFARRFGQQADEEEAQVESAEAVRKSFNSPFWPFILATTSLGQEGLDFHPYCHAVVHWNLPSNPVDLEQREGRVHRYKGHAIRKNVARRFGESVLWSGRPDVWSELFRRAAEECAATSDELRPYWIYPLEGGASVERHVPALPLSRELLRYRALCRSLAVYRMVFGQPRQEDLTAFLLEHYTEEEIARLRDLLRIDLAPPGVRARRVTQSNEKVVPGGADASRRPSGEPDVAP